MSVRKPRVALLVNIVAPYRIPIYRKLGEYFELGIFIGGREDNRETWVGLEAQLPGAWVKRSWGITVNRRRWAGGRVFDDGYLHITPGYLLDLLRFRPDAIISNEMGFRTLVALLFGSLFRKPVWVWWGGTLHTEKSIGRVKRFLRRLIVLWAKRWISYGQTSTEYLLHLGVARDRILQIQNCVDETLYLRPVAPEVYLEPKPVLLYVGRMVERKGVRLLLESARRVQGEGHQFSLLLVGGGPERGTLEAYAQKLGLRHVHFYPPQPPEKMPAIYRSADCLVFPTLEDVWGLVVNEALWSGIPVLSSIYAGCTPEIVPKVNRFDPLDPEDFDRVLRMAVKGELHPPDTTPLLCSDEVARRIIVDVKRILDT